MSDGHNATFHSFKPSGKWYATGRGILAPDTFKVFGREERRFEILKANGGRYPGLSGGGEEFVFVVLPDEDMSFAYPLMLLPLMNIWS